VRVLREALTTTTGTTRIRFTAEQRRRLAIKGKVFTPQERRQPSQIVRPFLESVGWVLTVMRTRSPVFSVGRRRPSLLFTRTVSTEGRRSRFQSVRSVGTQLDGHFNGLSLRSSVSDRCW
jgi:hypothetical protein